MEMAGQQRRLTSDFQPETVSTIVDLLAASSDARLVVEPGLTLRATLPQFENFNPEDADRCYSAGGPWIAIPDVWIPINGRDPAPDLTLHVLSDARIYGGSMTRLSDSMPHRHWSGQLLTTSRDELFSGSYGILDGAPSLPGDLVEDTTDGPILNYSGPTEALAGEFLFIGSVHSHFGHVMLEGLSRLWALEQLPESMRASIKLLIYEPVLPEFAALLLARLGFGPERIVHAPPSAIVERLLVPSPAMQTHVWVREQQGRTWQAIAGAPGIGEATGRRLYLSRRAVPHRSLSNEAEIEQLLAGAGYEIIVPEAMTIDEQIGAVRQADSLVGCVGSAMYLAAFQKPGGRNVVIAPRNFFLIDDVLVANAVGHELRVVLGEVRAPWADVTPWTCDPLTVKRVLEQMGLFQA